MVLRRHLIIAASLTVLGAFSLPVQAQQQGAQQQGGQQQGAPAAGQPEEEEPTPAPLTVGSMAIASDAALAVTGMAADIAVDRVTYSYRLRNKGPTKLSLAASVTLPDLELSSQGNTFNVLPVETPENPVGLEVRVNGKPVPTSPQMQAVALGVDRIADLKAANIPLIPFGETIDKALASAKPDTLVKLGRLGLLTPRDPAQPNSPVAADWSLRVVHSWMQPLDPNVDTNVAISFMPVKAVYTIDASSVGGFDSMKEQVCLTPQISAAIKALLKVKGSTADVADITLSNDGPARWLENPPIGVAVRKPTPDSIVTFCGMDPASQNQLIVRGKMANNDEASGLRVLIFMRNTAK